MEQDAEKLPQGLYIIATPIGNMGDITSRAVDTLGKVDAIACEDTRETGKLTAFHGLETRKIQYHDHNAAQMRPVIVDMIQKGAAIALVSDAGMPLVSDPGYKLVRACLDAGLMVTCAPGASASLVALALSGLPTDRFMFAGFLPVKTGARKTALSEVKAVPATLIFYETAPRLLETLLDMKDILGDRPAAVARELTKKFEEVRRGTLSELIAHYTQSGPPKGEIVIVIDAPKAGAGEIVDMDGALEKAMFEDGLSVKDAAALVAMKTGVKKSDVYARALQLKKQHDGQ